MSEELILTNLIHNDEFIKRALPFLKLSYFQYEENKLIFEQYVRYYAKYNTKPTAETLAHEIAEIEEIRDDTLENTLESLGDLEQDEEPNIEWLVNTTEGFCQERAIYNAIQNSIDIIDGVDEKHTKHAIPDILKKALSISFDVKLGHDYLEDAEKRFEFYNLDHPRIEFDIEMLNKITNGGCPRKTLNVLLGTTNVGKAESIFTKLLTPTGIKMFGDLKVNDYVYGSDGNPTKIINTYPQGELPLYEITFKDGRSTQCSYEHLWNVYKGDNKEQITIDSNEIFRLMDLKYYSKRLWIPLSKPINFNKEYNFNIDPYLMGVYLGDGTTMAESIGISSNDNHIIEKIKNIIDIDDMDIKYKSKYDYIIKSRFTGENEYLTELKQYNLFKVKSDKKFIPKEMMNSTIQNRWDLLTGLIDSDGYCGKHGTLQYYTTSEQLKNDVIDLVRSLGGIATSKDKQTYCNGKKGLPSYDIMIKINPENGLNISPNKKNVEIFNNRIKIPKLKIESIKKIHKEECMCIKVEAKDHLYLTKDFIVTHNTLGLVHMATAYMNLGYNVAYITAEMSEEAIGNRVDANEFQVNVNDVEDMDFDIFMNKINAIKNKTKGRLKIHEYPTSTAHTGHIKTLLQEWQLKMNFTPDIIMIDYINIMASSRVKLANTGSYFYIKAIAEEFRALAVETNTVLWTATQSNRGGANNPDVDLTDTSESFGLPATADFMLALIRTEELDALGQLMIKQLKSRYGNKGYYEKFVIGSNINTMSWYDVDDTAQFDDVIKEDTKQKHKGKFDDFKI